MLVLLLVVIISYLAIASSTVAVVGNYQLNQKMRNDKYSVEKMAVSVTQLFLNKDIKGINKLIERLGGEYRARLMILDKSGKVIADSYSRAEGMRISLKEVNSILTYTSNSDYGLYKLSQANSGAVDVDNSVWINVCTASILSRNGVEGLVLFSSSTDELISNLNNLQSIILRFFGIAAFICLAVAMYFSGLITQPIKKLTESIQKMGQGDFSVRVEEKGSSEIKDLSRTFNNMSEKLENLEKSRNQFISNASHELKTPLATMKILLENIIYQDDMDPDIAREFLTDINKEIDRLNSVVNDLLTLVSLDNKSITLKIESFSLSELVSDISKKTDLLAEKRNQTLNIDIEPNIIISADSAKLHHIFYNLIDNAIKYTGEGGTIDVSLHSNGKIAVFKVKDNGPGIPKEDLKSIFDRFYRVDKARSRDTGGTGLGLSIVNQMVMIHNGRIYVDSDLGKGTEFTVELPLVYKKVNE